MFITTLARFDMETGECLERQGYDYFGPLALCDRAAKSTAQTVGNTATGLANEYGTNAAAVGNALLPQVESRAAAPPGLGAALPGMVANAGATAASNAGKAAQNARLRGMRTGNAAGQGAVDVGAAQAGGQNETAAMQGILGQNALLENTQQQAALNQMQGLYGTDLGATQGFLNTANNAANAMTNANTAGWLQNTTGLMKAIAGLNPAGSIGNFSFGKGG
ncbi:MAG: hypothetical protein ACREKE_02415 [bacterium]